MNVADLEIPTGLTNEQQRLFITAAADGYSNGRGTGFQEQNPYHLMSPLFDAWRQGWFLGVYDTPVRELNEKSLNVRSTLPSILNSAWRKTCSAFNHAFHRQGSGGGT